MMSVIPCIFCFDAAFAKIAAVAITSVLAHSNHRCRLYCIVHDVSEDDLEVIRLIARRYDAKLTILVADHERFASWKTGRHFSPANYYRLVAPDLVPEERAIYLDSDLLVTCDLEPLINVDLGDAWMAGCIDVFGGSSSKIPRSEADPYLNTGVLLLNLEELRKAGFLEETRLAYTTYEADVRWSDQCLINKVAESRKLLTDARWNVQAHSFGKPSSLQPHMEPFDGRGILHFSGGTKPWMEWSGSWESQLWFGYARLTGLSRAELLRRPLRASEWKQLAWKHEQEGDWQAAAGVIKLIANHYEDKASSRPPASP
jgi:lipopolysaccharide biosynthesis glycosyltransferase